MNLRQHRRHRSRIQGALSRSGVWMPVDFTSSGYVTMRRVRVDLRPAPGSYRGQTYAVFENFITKPGEYMVGPEIVSFTPEGRLVRGSQP
jgi:hypothetical protein